MFVKSLPAVAGVLLVASSGVAGAVTPQAVQKAVDEGGEQVIAWRRDFHANPELSNREFRTSKIVAEQLEAMGFEVKTGIAHTGVVGLLRGGRPGPVVALRADMDALPVTEQNDLPFRSTVRATYNGQETGVMHACGHDAHVAIALGAARVLAGMREQLTGTVMMIFQPAEEGPPKGEDGGAELMLEEGLFEIAKPDAIFGLHVWSALNAGQIGYRSGPMMASSDRIEITVNGRQTHGSKPWGGIDPIVVASQIVMNLQTITSRQVDITRAPAVVSIGSIHGGIRNNIIPDSVTMLGTVRTFDQDMRTDIAERIKRTVTTTAEAAGTSASIEYDFGYPVTVNHPALTARSVSRLEAVVGADNVGELALITGAEDFSYFQMQVPGFYFMLGATAPGRDAGEAPSNHSPMFTVDESTLETGVLALSTLALMALADSESG
jgi:amidohydrolase